MTCTENLFLKLFSKILCLNSFACTARHWENVKKCLQRGTKLIATQTATRKCFDVSCRRAFPELSQQDLRRI